MASPQLVLNQNTQLEVQLLAALTPMETNGTPYQLNLLHALQDITLMLPILVKIAQFAPLAVNVHLPQSLLVLTVNFVHKVPMLLMSVLVNLTALTTHQHLQLAPQPNTSTIPVAVAQLVLPANTAHGAPLLTLILVTTHLRVVISSLFALQVTHVRQVPPLNALLASGQLRHKWTVPSAHLAMLVHPRRLHAINK